MYKNKKYRDVHTSSLFLMAYAICWNCWIAGERRAGTIVTPRFPKYAEMGSRRESATYIHEENTPRIYAKPKCNLNKL